MTTSVALLAQRLAGGGQSAIVASGSPFGDDLPVVEIPLEVLLDDAGGLEESLDDPIIERAQLVLLIPPLGRSRLKASRYDMSEIAARNMAAALAPDKRFGSVLLLRSISGRRPAPLLNEIFTGRHLSTVIELPARELYEQVSFTMRVCVVVLDIVEPPRTVLLSIRRGADVEVVLGEYETLVSEGGRTAHGFALEEPVDYRLGFLPNQLDPERVRRIEQTSSIGPLRRLGDLCEATRGLGPGVRPRQHRDRGDVPLLSARLIRNGRIATDQVDNWVEPSAGQLLQAGDVVIRTIAPPGSRIQAAEVYEDDLPMIAGRHVLVLRPGSEFLPAERRVLIHFIGTRRFSEQLVSHHANLTQIPTAELADVLVPVPNTDFLNAFQTVESALEDFEQWRNEAEALLESSLDSDDLEDARQQLIGSSNLSRQRADAARQLDDLDHRVITRFPLPVAHRWRLAVAARDGPSPLRSVLHAQEVLLAYLSIMTLTAAAVENVNIGHLKKVRDRLNKRRSGMMLSDWRVILSEAATAKAFQSLPKNHPFVEVRDFFRDPDVDEASGRLVELRNDSAHLREYGPGELETILHTAWSDLKLLFLAAEFTTEYPLVRVLETRWDSFEDRNKVTYRHLAGDNPIVPRKVMSVTSCTIETDSLYLLDASKQPHLLRPWMIGTDCPDCGHWSTFHPDRFSDGKFYYKSLEHGHTKPMHSSIDRELARIGLLD